MNDIHHYLLNYINNVDDLNKYCSQNKYFLNLCKENTHKIAKHFLDLYKVDYKDPTNFIYVYNDKDINDYKINDNYKLGSIFKLYMKNYYDKKIKCEYLDITSFPIYPNMEVFKGIKNKLTTFPIQPKMEYFYGHNNQFNLI